MVELRPQPDGTILVASMLLVMLIPESFDSMEDAIVWMKERDFVEISPNIWEPA